MSTELPGVHDFLKNLSKISYGTVSFHVRVCGKVGTFGTLNDLLHCFVIGKGDFGSLQNKFRFGCSRDIPPPHKKEI
jgi:hypothetical protein